MKALLIIFISLILLSSNLFAQGANQINFGINDSLDTGTINLAEEYDGSADLSSTFQYYFGGDIIADDTLEIGTSSDFANSQKILPDIFYPFPQEDIRKIKNLYIRRFSTAGATGTVHYSIRVWGY